MGLFGPTKKQLGERAQAHVIAKFLEVGTTYSFLMGTVLGMIWSLKMLKGGSGVCKSRLPG